MRGLALINWQFQTIHLKRSVHASRSLSNLREFRQPLISRPGFPDQNDRSVEDSFRLPGRFVSYAETGTRERGSGARNGGEEAENTLLLARHAVFRRGTDDRQSPVSSGVLRNYDRLLSKRYSGVRQNEKKEPSRALFSAPTVVQSAAMHRNRWASRYTRRQLPEYRTDFDGAIRDQARIWAFSKFKGLHFQQPLFWGR